MKKINGRLRANLQNLMKLKEKFKHEAKPEMKTMWGMSGGEQRQMLGKEYSDCASTFIAFGRERF